jgi:hypothetical protein
MSVWESYEHHQKLINSPGYASIVEALKPAVAGKSERDHFEITVDPTKAFDEAQTTEIVILKAKGESIDGIQECIARLRTELDKAPNAFPPAVWGESIEEPGKFIGCIGWTSRQVCVVIVAPSVFS